MVTLAVVPTAVLLLYLTVYSLAGITMLPSLTVTSGFFAVPSYSKVSGSSSIVRAFTGFGAMVTAASTTALSL